jgi:dTDP-4-dehydrorhamnose 3,5-epimerase-like enzyme
MARIINLSTFSDVRGNLTVMDNIADLLPFSVKRMFYIYGADASERGGHRHKKTYQAAICLGGTCVIGNHDGRNRESFVLDMPNKCLILEPQDWHTMEIHGKHAMLMVFASECYDSEDYIYEPYDS